MANTDFTQNETGMNWDDEYRNAKNAEFIKKMISKPTTEGSGFIESGTGLGTYLEALVKDDRAKLVDAGHDVVSSVFSSITALGAMMANSDARELASRMPNIGWLLVTLSDLGANAAHHASEAKFLIEQAKNNETLN